MLSERFSQFAIDEGIDLTGRVLVGLSGGIDSVVLVDLVHPIADELVCLHVNYGLRGVESQEDERFVREFCERRNIALVVVDARYEMRSQAGRSTQAAARTIRYREFAREATARGIDAVLLAHHADDQVETVLMSLFRGAGVHGLAGMPVSRPTGDGSIRVVRPLLFARRSEIEVYAAEHGLVWREDSSNMEPRYRRSVLRHQILPLIEQHFGQATSDNILRSSELARRLIEANRSEGSPLSPSEGENILRIVDMEALPDVVRTRRILDTLARVLPGAPRTRAVAEQINRLISQQPGRRVQLEDGVVIREREALLFAPSTPRIDDLQRPFPVELRAGETVRIPGGVLFAHRLLERPAVLDSGTAELVYADAGRLGDGLVVEPWKDGDRISLLGTDGSKKVSDLLTDAKIPVSERRSVLVARANGKVVWVVGVRLSADFAVDVRTESVIALGIVRPRAV